MDRAVDDGEGQSGPELGPGGSCGVHSWIEETVKDLRGIIRSGEPNGLGFPIGYEGRFRMN